MKDNPTIMFQEAKIPCFKSTFHGWFKTKGEIININNPHDGDYAVCKETNSVWYYYHNDWVDSGSMVSITDEIQTIEPIKCCFVCKHCRKYINTEYIDPRKSLSSFMLNDIEQCCCSLNENKFVEPFTNICDYFEKIN